MSKIIIFGLIILILEGGLYFFYQKGQFSQRPIIKEKSMIEEKIEPKLEIKKIPSEESDSLPLFRK